MPKPRPRPPGRRPPSHLPPSQQATPGLLVQRGLGLPAERLPSVRLRTHTFHPLIYQRMLEGAERAAGPGDLVAGIDRRGERFGFGHYNPRSENSVRMIRHWQA
ncbi:MAG: hypothetical protein JNG90_07030, partial [Planctomycetaceae bacterium]|nr:hypothetical protein [Planctomycetaceae bacterium]